MLIVILLCVVFVLWKFSWKNESKSQPPALPGALPLIGHAHRYNGDSKHLWNVIKETSYECLKLGGVASAYIGPMKIYILTDPNDILTVANTCLQKDILYSFAKPWLGNGLVTGSLPIWKNHRKLLNPAFNREVLYDFLKVFNKQSRRLVKDIEPEIKNGSFDHWTYIRHNTLETICLTTLGVDFSEKSLLNKNYVLAAEKMFELLVERFRKIWLHFRFIYNRSSLKNRQNEYLRALHNLSKTIIQRRKTDYLNNKNDKKITQESKFKPFMDILLELALEKGSFNDREIREHVDTMIVGGYDTSANVLMYTMLMVGSYPKVQEKIFEELDDIFGDDDRDITKHDLSRLIYLEAVLKETIRIYPIVPIIARRLDKNVKLREYTLDKGHTCFMCVYGVHRHPMWGPDAEEFKPERWLNPETLPECPAAFAGFSMGRRSCIGKSYALMSMKTTLSHVFRNYVIEGDHTNLKFKYDIMLKPISGNHISIKSRKK